MPCPICGKDSAERYRPFCSRRCSDVDLGRWLTGAYVVPGPDVEEDQSSDTGEDGKPRPQ